PRRPPTIPRAPTAARVTAAVAVATKARPCGSAPRNAIGTIRTTRGRRWGFVVRCEAARSASTARAVASGGRASRTKRIEQPLDQVFARSTRDDEGTEHVPERPCHDLKREREPRFRRAEALETGAHGEHGSHHGYAGAERREQ